jgi:DHA1 family bicyclomycin/chloramphenicol resistance-like MFS transporter
VILANYWRVGGHLRFISLCLGNALTFSGVSIYIGSAPAVVYSILHLSERDFGWLFIPLIGGMTVGSMLSARASHRFSPGTIIRAGFAIMLLSATGNIGYNLVFAARVPWAVVAPFFYCLGMSLAAPAMSMRILDMFPQTRGLASSLMSFFFMTIFAVISGLLCPLVFDSALHLAETIFAGLLLSLLFWWLGGLGSGVDVPVPQCEPREEVLIEL